MILDFGSANFWVGILIGIILMLLIIIYAYIITEELTK